MANGLCTEIDEDDASAASVESNVEYFTCPVDHHDIGNGSIYVNGSYSQAASLFFVTGEDAIHHLYSRNTHLQVRIIISLITM